MSNPENIEVTVFSEPSGNVRGMVVAFMTVKAKARRIAYATLMVGGKDTISLDVPKTLTVADIAVLTETLTAFTPAVQANSSQET